MNIRIAVILAGVLIVTSMVPVSQASHQQIKVPPHQSGEGNNDVEDEIGGSHPQDKVPPTNGFLDTPFNEPKLVLEMFYEANYWQVDADYNNVFRELTDETAAPAWEDVIYPGLGYFNAWWGWWSDKGSGHQLNDEDNGPASGTGASSSPNDAIDDAHDNTDRWDGDPNHGPWDEFLWRGDNKFAPKHPFTANSDLDGAGKVRYPGDSMKLFFSPGSKYTAPFFSDFDNIGPSGLGPRPGLLLDEKDDPHRPEWSLSDRTSYGAYALEAGPSGAPQFGGWVSENGWMHFQYDTSLLMSAKAVASVNPEPEGDGLFDPHDPTNNATDVDVYSAAHPQVEDVYRTTVWNPDEGPGDSQDNVYPLHDEGPKEHVKEEFTERSTTTYRQMASLYNEIVAPARGVQGVADDNAGFRPQTHEPNHPDDDYNDLATFDADTAYGGVQTDSYYRPGGKTWNPGSPNAGTQTYDDYVQENPWLDMQAGFGVPGLLIALSNEANMNFHPAPNLDGGFSDQGDDDSAAPGYMWFTGNLGLWKDHTGDTFVGDLDEDGRAVSSEQPYNQGNTDDPNDYGDNANSKVDDASPAEWQGVHSATVTMTVEPLTDGQRWGNTGIYVYSDAGGQFNPYDDVVADLTGGLIFSDQDNYGDGGGQLSRHVMEGPITLSASPVTQDGSQGLAGLWSGDQYLILPEGTANYPIKVTTTATTQVDIPMDGGRTLDKGTTLTDVDVVNSWT